MLMRNTFIAGLPVLGILVTVNAVAAEVAEKTGKAVERVNVEPLSGGSIAQVVLGLLFVLCLVIAMAWLFKRMGGLSVTGNGALKILGGISMGARERVVLMQVGEEQLLLGVSPGRIQTLHVLAKPINVEEKNKAEPGFAERLSEALARRGGK